MSLFPPDGTVLEDVVDRLFRFFAIAECRVHASSLQVRSQATVSCSQPEYSGLLMSCPTVNWVSNPTSKKEMYQAIKHLKNGKSAGPDNIPADALETNIEASVELLYLLFKIWDEQVLSEWIMNIKTMIVNTAVKPVLLYEAEMWRTTTATLKEIKTFVNTCLEESFGYDGLRPSATENSGNRPSNNQQKIRSSKDD